MSVKPVVVFVSIPLLLLLAIALFLSLHLDQTTGRAFVFDIPRGDSLSSIVKRLHSTEALPVDRSVFKALALLTRDDGAILAGQYQIDADMTAADLLALFRSGKVIQYRITFPEGWALKEWLDALAAAPHLTLLAGKLNRQELAVELGIEGDPEGWLFPDTYQYTKGDSDIDLLRLAFARMEQVLAEEWQARGVLTHIESRREALILASVIEKETGYDPDRAKIASVFHNRLNAGMKLQSDPTVIYGLGEAFDGDLKRSHLRADSPYNSYTRRGLPIGAICSPGRASIRAALAGSGHEYLYFVARGDGTSYFSKTLKQHNQAVNRYQRQP